MSAAYEEHKRLAPKKVRVTIITVSTSRYEKASQGIAVDDLSGSKALEMVKKSGHKVASRKLVNDDKEMIRLEVLRSLFDEGADVVILTGGTGLAKRDVTIESIMPLLDKEMGGFGEIFRALSYQKIGSPAYLSMALAGTLNGKIIFCLPGAPQAVELALNLILPELSHMVYITKG
ncbi:MAG: MogA/MoaB family molybdenum cofactor biosynthesis protein [Candidatus Methylarchaceae archaeon HK02M1]|nr:MogA/MoaB family molybdenum cofactor biosynthesis protein [Candidatus Methylarchaceae archaeon HK01M]MCP8311814.1 MogA/MoaB family molybdenum cofactor biosynthesis protein [Candidatus Methylarchaceae archaeon HK02M1]